MLVAVETSKSKPASPSFYALEDIAGVLEVYAKSINELTWLPSAIFSFTSILDNLSLTAFYC